MASLRGPLLLLLLPPLLLLSMDAALAGLVVTSGAVRPMDPTDDHRLLEQHWWVDTSVGDGWLGAPASLREITLRVPGRVFVSQGVAWTSDRLGAPPSVASVRISGNSQQLFEYIEVVATSPTAIEVRQRPDATAPLRDVYLLVEIQVAQPMQVQTLLSAASADVVVEDRVLVASRPDVELQVSTTGSGDIFIRSSTPAEVAKATVNIAGSGDVSWSGPRLHANAFMVNIVGSGDATIRADTLVASAMDVHIAGSGDVCVQVPGVFRADHLGAAILGSGDLALASGDGRAGAEELHVAGSGDVTLSDVVGDVVTVSVAGSGDVLVQATGSIVGSTWGGGGVQYVGDRPAQISDRRHEHVFSAEQDPKYKPVATPRRTRPRAVHCDVSAPPSRRAVLISMNAGSSKLLLVPLVVLALLSACYLRHQMRTRRRRARGGGAASSFAERQPLQPAPYYHQPGDSTAFGFHQPPPPQQQQQQQQSSQVYV
ncbi:hypothetical protein ATCC90586_003461 [Pythium insidiosum]|nr:hypothetical protein ATCC90586_003461 [Pythium insidiosum]